MHEAYRKACIMHFDGTQLSDVDFPFSLKPAKYKQNMSKTNVDQYQQAKKNIFPRPSSTHNYVFNEMLSYLLSQLNFRLR